MGRKVSESKATEALGKIVEAMSGMEWDSKVGNQVADILYGAGYEIAAPDPARVPPAKCPKCEHGDELCVSETYTAYHPYNAQRHTAECLPEGSANLDDGEGDYAAHCNACGHSGTLEEFGMKLLDWVEFDDDDEDDDDKCAHTETSDTPDFGSAETCKECGFYFSDGEDD